MDASLWHALQDPRLVWGLVSRGLGVVFLVAFVSLSRQVLPYAGRRGAMPVARVLAGIQRDFASPRRYVYFPTLLWLSASDRMLRGLTLAGMFAAAWLIIGGALSPLALLGCYVCYLSLDVAMTLDSPWDNLLFECALLGCFLPATQLLPGLAAVAAPAPVIAWAYRILLFRLLFGFGKQAFAGHRAKDLGFLEGFLVNQPSPTKLGWYAAKLPLPVLQVAAFCVLSAGLFGAFTALMPGTPSLWSAGLTVCLMLGLSLLGNFGFFSLITSLLCLPLLDAATPAQFELGAAFGSVGLGALSVFVALHTLSAVAALPFDGGLAQSFQLWAFWHQLPRPVRSFVGFLQLLRPLRWVHPYGGFAPDGAPAVKVVPVFEASWDHKTWHELGLCASPSGPSAAPRFIAPYHAPADRAVVNDAFGLNAQSLVSGMRGPWSPYPHASRAPLRFFCQALLRGDAQGFLDGAALAQHPSPPLAVRVTTHLLEAVSLEEHRRTGKWWKRRYIGPHLPAEALDPAFWSDALGEPELWHFEAISWRRRSCLGPVMARAETGQGDPMELALEGADGIGAEDVSRFWQEFVPLFSGAARRRFDTLPELREELSSRFDRRGQRALARLLGRFASCLVARFEPLYLGQGKPALAAPTYFHLWLLAHHIIGCGRSAYLEAYAEPLSAAAHLPELTAQSGLYALAAFRFDALCFEAQKLRLIEAMVAPHDPAAKRAHAAQLRAMDFATLPFLSRWRRRVACSVSGYFHVLSDLRDGFKGAPFNAGHAELYPRFRELESGELDLDEDDALTPRPTSWIAPSAARALRTSSDPLS